MNIYRLWISTFGSLNVLMDLLIDVQYILTSQTEITRHHVSPNARSQYHPWSCAPKYLPWTWPGFYIQLAIYKGKKSKDRNTC